jgi:hypothetical protein
MLATDSSSTDAQACDPDDRPQAPNYDSSQWIGGQIALHSGDRKRSPSDSRELQRVRSSQNPRKAKDPRARKPFASRCGTKAAIVSDVLKREKIKASFRFD